MATVSFVASRAAPAGGFFLALAGGTALARAAERRGARAGFGTSLAATLESVALMGPIRVGVPLTQAVSAPLLGRLHARGARMLALVLACALVRVVHNALTTAFVIWIVLGGLDAYAGTYAAILERLPLLPPGERGALLVTAASIAGWTVFASTVQALVYRRGLLRWPAGEPAPPPADADEAAPPPRDDPAARGGAEGGAATFDPRAVVLAAAVAFAVLLSTTAWPMLAAVGAWLGVAWATARPERGPVRTGVALTAMVAGGALVFTAIGGLGVDAVLRRTLRAALLVLVATWLRAAAGSEGLREVGFRGLRVLRRLPAMEDAAHALAGLASERRLLAAGRSLLDAIGPVPNRPLPVVDAVLGWAAGEASKYRVARPPARRSLRARRPDVALVALACATSLAAIAG